MNKQTISAEIVKMGILGASIRNNPELLDSYEGRIPQECIDAAEIIQNNFEQFRQLVWNHLENLPLTKKYFSNLIRGRLKQKGILASPIISEIFDEHGTLEKKLENIQTLAGVDLLKSEYRGSENPLRGDITDNTARNMLAEIITLDFLISLGFVKISKTSRKDKSHIDIFAEKDGQSYCIDVTRKQEVDNWEINPDTELEDCQSSKNQKEIYRKIAQALSDKDDQFYRARYSKTISEKAIRVIAIKTSDYGFAECIEVASMVAQQLLSEKEKWRNIDCIWLLPNVDVNESRWVFRKTAG
jgi:hypothetical protein